MKFNARLLALVALVVAVGAVFAAVSAGGASSRTTAAPSGSLTVWVDAVRLPVAKLYAKTHPKVHLNIVTYDGDGNGATTMQTKIQLWNRTGKGWPAPSLGQCTVNGHLVCLQDNLAQEVLYVNKKLMGQFGYQVPKTWQQWAELGAKVAKDHPGYIIGNMGDSYSHWLYLWPDRCPISQVVAPKTVRINSTHRQCTRMAQLLDPLIKSGVVPPESIFTPSFAQKYGGASDKILLMPGPTWYAKDIFGGTLKVPAGEITAAMPLRWNNEPPTTGQVGGGPWVVSKHTKNLPAAIDFVKFVTTTNAAKAVAPGYPSYGPAANFWLAKLNKDPYFAAPPGAAMKAAAALVWKGWSMVSYQDQPVWSTAVVTQLVAGKSLSDQLPALGEGLSNNAKAAGYKVVNK